MAQAESKLAQWIRLHPVKSQRALEILPGLFSWFMITFPLWGSFVIPEVVAYYIITFNIYWLYRSVSIAILGVIAHFKFKASQQYDWLSELKNLPSSSSIHHIIVIPTYKEPLTTLRRTVNALKNQTFSPHNLHLMISFEEREGAEAQTKAQSLLETYRFTFGDIWTTFHPDIAGEVKGKSSNTSWAAKVAKTNLVDKNQVSIEQVTITSLDADAVPHPQYFAALTYYFLRNPKRYQRIWQAGIMFYNNIWNVPAPVRVMASVFSVFQMYVLMRPDSLMNFSTYSTSLKLVHEIGYWDTNVIPEDYRLFFKAFFATKGQLEVEPIFIPVYNDAAESHGFWNTMINQYEQIKRWAWGVSDDAYIIKNYITVSGVPFWEKTLRVLHVLESHFLWPVNWFAITVGALLPPLLNPVFSRTVLGKTLPQTSSLILTISLVSMVVIFVLDAVNRPPRPQKASLFEQLFQPLEYMLLPVIGFFFSALPGVDAHTRLMFGKYIEYRVTEKV